MIDACMRCHLHQNVAYVPWQVYHGERRFGTQVDRSMNCLRVVGLLGGKEIRCIKTCNISSFSARLPRPQQLRFLDQLAVEMADKKEREISSSTVEKEKEKEKVKRETEEKKEEEEESPPEKPEPGDCCGSGCVRCVWDIYYDELDEYNKRQKRKKEKG